MATTLIRAAADLALAPIAALAAQPLKLIRRYGLGRLPITRRVLQRVGVLPVRAHYYEPMATEGMLHRPLSDARPLPGIDLRPAEQRALLADLAAYAPESAKFPMNDPGDGRYHYRNRFFASGDAEILYAMVRHHRPRRVIEIGSGFSTLLVRAAVERGGFPCDHVCIEPYENPWLDRTGARIVRERVEQVDRSIFAELGAGDILFIDSTHTVRPQGDVLAEILEILPILSPGVLVHVHDIFTPHDYPRTWVLDEMRLWHEQYMLEAFLSCNPSFRIVAAVNYLAHHHRDALSAAAPVYATEADRREPGSFWMQRVAH